MIYHSSRLSSYGQSHPRLTTALIGHRGVAGLAPENTIAGFKSGLAMGLQVFELDLHITRDAKLAVIHDAATKRLSRVNVQVSKRSAKELGRIDVGKYLRYHQGVPTLNKVLNLCPEDTQFQLEVKTRPMPEMTKVARALCSLINKQKLHNQVVVTSMNSRFLYLLREKAPEIKRGLIWDCRYRNPVELTSKLSCHLLCAYHKAITPTILRQAEEQELDVSLWTVNEAATVENFYKSRAIKSYISDRPDRLISALSKYPNTAIMAKKYG